MSKKRDDSYFAAERRKKRKIMMIAIPVGIAVVIAAVAASLSYQQLNPYGPVGSAHVHAVFAIKLNGQAIDFSQQKYQVKSNLIHVENLDGTTLHRHATAVPFGEFLKSVKMDISNGCFTNDDGTKFCNEGDKTLKFYVNGQQVNSITDYVVNDNDHLLVLYGNENSEQIQQELAALQNTPVRK